MNKRMSGFEFTRRDFIKTSAAVSAATVLVNPGGIFAAGPQKIKVGLIGCGGRGNGALKDCSNAVKHLSLEMQVVSVADYFKKKAVKTGKEYNVPEEMCFEGPEGYKKLLATDIDLVLMATAPNFRPVHFDAAIKAGKHVFMEKPVAVDPPGVRRIIQTGELAAQKKLSVVAGTQRRHQADYLKTQYAVANGAIGTIVGGSIWWCGGQLWFVTKEPGESDADYMIRNWVSFAEASGDHIVEQHLHNLDVANWFIGRPPVSAIGFGGRARRKTGNQYDFFSIDFDYDKGCRIHSSCRQVNGCYSRVSETFTGTEGTTMGDGRIQSANKKQLSIPDFEEHGGPYVQEHVDLLRSIIDGKPLNEARNVAESTMTGIMGRISAYTGQLVRWTDLMDEQSGSPWYDLTLKPTAEDFEKGEVTAPPDDVIPIPGKE